MQQRDQKLTYDIFEDQEEGFDIKGWLIRVLRLWPWFVITGILTFLIAYFYLRYTEPVYQASAAIMIKDEKKGGGSVLDNPLLQELNIGGKGSLIENEIEVLRSFDLIEEAILKENLYINVKNKGKIANWTNYGKELPFVLEIANPEEIVQSSVWTINTSVSGKWSFTVNKGGNSIPIILGKWIQNKKIQFRFWPNINFSEHLDKIKNTKQEFEICLTPLDISTQRYKNALTVAPIGKAGSVISLSINDFHPERSKKALQALISIYNQKGLEDKNMVNSNTIDFLTERLKVVENELKNVEGKVANYKRTNQITNISSEAEVFLERASDIDKRKADQETKVNIIEALEKELLLNQDNPRLVPSSLGIVEPSMAILIQRHNELILQRDRLSEVAGTKNPALIDINNQVRDVRISLIENVKNLRASFNIAMNDIKRQDNRVMGRLGGIPALEKNLIQISRDRNVKEQLYMFLLQKREESAVALASAVNDSRIVEKPRALGQISPKRNRIYGIAAGIALILPLIIMIVLDFFDNKVGSKKEIETKTKAPVLGEISYVKEMDAPIQITSQSRSIVAEQLRGIRTGLSFTGKGASAKTILITSHRPGEGKSFTSLNLGASYALLNKKVVILEFDLRKPRLMKNMGYQADQGISNFLSRDTSIDDLLVEIPGYEQNFWLLPAGPVPPNPAELILGPFMQKLIDDLSLRFDHIIIDSPPFSVVTDATLLQQYVNINVIVLRQGYTIKEAYDDINQRIQQFPDLPIYLVLNGVGKTKKHSYYGSKYGYAYGYAYGYGEAEVKGKNKNSKNN